MGDFDINLLNVDNVLKVNEFLDTVLLNNLFPLIKYPTRISQHSATLIDNIFTNDDSTLLSGLLLSDVSDHFPIFCICNNIITHSSNNRFSFKREITEENISRFAQYLNNVKWDFSNLDPNESYNKFENVFLDAYDLFFPIERKTTRKRNNYKAWFNDEIRKLIKKKNRLYKLYLKNPTDYRKNTFKKIRNKVVSKIKQAKKQYFKELFKTIHGNNSKTWNVINKALGKEKQQTIVNKIIANNEVVTDKKLIPEFFNNYFVKVGSKLNSEFTTCDKKHIGKYIKKNEKSAFFKNISSNEIVEIVKDFKNNTSAGADGVDIRVVKGVINYVCDPLSAIFDKCLEFGIFPDKLKVARVVPVFKKGSKEILSNYRPISVLPIFSKIFEKCIYNRLLAFIKECNIFTSNQYGFRERHSTTHALVNFVHNVIRAIENEDILIGIFLDLSKAFDTLDHDILFYKLNFYGIRGVILDLFKSYLSNRVQYVTIDGIKSSCKPLECGVPQGSVLGPLLFLLYINDLCNTSNILKYILFADDTSLFLSHKNISKLQTVLNTELIKISKWLYMNKLSLNIGKTQYMVFTKKHVNLDDISIKLAGSEIKHETSLKFLGITIDQNLTWKQHINFICNKISKNIGVLSKLRTLPKCALKCIYHATISPFFDYGLSVWGSAATCHLERLFRLQKRAIRIIDHSSFLSHTPPIFHSQRILTLYDRYQYVLGIIMFLWHKKLLPDSLLEYFSLNCDIHNYFTRSAAKFHLPKIRTSLFYYSVIYQGPIIWNSLPMEIRQIDSLNLFKRKMKNYFIDKYNTS